MKALTLTQPWATLVALGEKKYETRSWKTTFRGWLAIHAAKGFPKYARDTCFTEYFWDIIGPMVFTAENAELPQSEAFAKELHLGCVVALAKLGTCWPTEGLHVTNRLTPQEEAFGDFGPNRYAWAIQQVIWLPEPIPAKGSLGLWEWDEPRLIANTLRANEG